MREVWVAADVVVSPLGNTSEENFSQLKKGVSGIKILHDTSLSQTPIAAGKIPAVNGSSGQSRFETICLKAIMPIIGRFSLPVTRTVFVLSTTKGNISALEGHEEISRIDLHMVSSFLAEKAGLNQNLVVSNACVSGVMAITVAKRLLQSGKYDHALVLGADELSRFVVTGFQSLQALSDQQCKPFDAERKGINLGEAAAAILLSSRPEELGITPTVKVLGSGSSNDANHISGPSRTGAELASAIGQALNESVLSASEIDFISAHGTATRYNDEMEAKAFNLAGLQQTPLNSLKGYYGHTLGAAGAIETVMGIHSLSNNLLIPALGFELLGVSQDVNVITKIDSKPLKTFLKTASGFGGCNAAIVLQKIN